MGKNKKISECLKDFLDFADKVKKDYEYSFSVVSQLDKEYKTDLAHEIELSPAKETNKVAAKMRTNRKDRRYYKDIMEEMEPIYAILTDSHYKKTFDMLVQALGKVRKAEEYHANRTYHPRIKEQDRIEKRIIL